MNARSWGSGLLACALRVLVSFSIIKTVGCLGAVIRKAIADSQCATRAPLSIGNAQVYAELAVGR